MAPHVRKSARWRFGDCRFALRVQLKKNRMQSHAMGSHLGQGSAARLYGHCSRSLPRPNSAANTYLTKHAPILAKSKWRLSTKRSCRTLPKTCSARIQQIRADAANRTATSAACPLLFPIQCELSTRTGTPTRCGGTSVVADHRKVVP